MTPDEYYDFMMEHADSDGRHQAADLSGWSIFPYEGPLTLRRLEPPQPEPARAGETSADCRSCAEQDQGLWLSENWRLITMPDSCFPTQLMLIPRQHCDVADMPDELAAELGPLLRDLTAAIEGLNSVHRAHIHRWGDGGAHQHWWLWGRPTGQLQLRGSYAGEWACSLPDLPAEEIKANNSTVVERLVSTFGGRANSFTPDSKTPSS